MAFSLPGWKLYAPATNNAFRISGEQDVVQLSTKPNVSGITMACWARITTDRNDYSAIFTIETGAGHSTEYNELITESDGTTLSVYDHVTGNIGTVGVMTVGTWYKVAIVFKAGSYDAYIGTEGVTALTKTSNTMANITTNDYTGVGASQFSSTEWFNGRLANLRVWNAELTQAQLESEFQSTIPIITSNLLGHWFPPTMTSGSPLAAATGVDLIDGNGGGTPDYTVEAGPTY